jgi:hypothetical protein
VSYDTSDVLVPVDSRAYIIRVSTCHVESKIDLDA